MALVQKKNTRQTTILLIVLFIVVIGGLVAYVFLRPAPLGSGVGVTGTGSRDPEIFTNFGESLYLTDQFRRLHDFMKDPATTETTPTPVPVLNSNVNGSGTIPQVDLPPNTTIGNPSPFTQ